MTLRFARYEVPMKIPSLLGYDAMSTGTVTGVSNS